MVRAGELAPDIELETDEGGRLRLSSLRGKTVVLYFYPRASTPGCTTEACELRDAFEDLSHLNAVVIGVSPDRSAAQQKFKTKYELPFTLLCDVEKSAAQAYGVWREKTMYGKKVMGIERTTFLIGEDGRIEKIFARVKPRGHGAEVLAALTAQGAGRGPAPR